MKLPATIELIKRYQPYDDNQALMKERLLAFIQGNPNCYESNHPPQKGRESEEEMGHVTGSAWVLSPDKKMVLLTHHKKLDKWLQLGGHSDGESHVILTAIREAKEESGIEDIRILSHEIFDIDIHTFPKKKGVEAHLHYDIRFCLQADNEDYKVSEESHNLKWIPLSKIQRPEYEESVVRMASKTKIMKSKSKIMELARGAHTNVEKTSHGMLIFGAGLATVFLTSLQVIGKLMGEWYCWFTFILLSLVIALGFFSKVIEYFEKLLRNVPNIQKDLKSFGKANSIDQSELVTAQQSILTKAWPVELLNARLFLGPEHKRSEEGLIERSYMFFILQFRALLFQIILLVTWFAVTFTMVLLNLVSPVNSL